MPNPPVGTIYWSSDAEQFYKIGQAGAISRLEGIESLRAVETATGTRYYDELGNRVPDPSRIIPESLTESFVGIQRDLSTTAQDPYTTEPGPDQYYTTWFIYHDLAGQVHVGYKNFPIGKTIDDEVEKAKIVAQIGDALSIDPTSEEGGSDKIWDLVSTWIHYIVS